ncbi:MAG: putative Ig domain-containing protein [Candidatus Marinamargulisbacteria bacterium]
MTDPVITMDGHTYEREAIEQWVKQNGTDPNTRKPLSIDRLFPNRVLRDVIEAYNQDVRRKAIEIELLEREDSRRDDDGGNNGEALNNRKEETYRMDVQGVGRKLYEGIKKYPIPNQPVVNQILWLMMAMGGMGIVVYVLLREIGGNPASLNQGPHWKGYDPKGMCPGEEYKDDISKGFYNPERNVLNYSVSQASKEALPKWFNVNKSGVVTGRVPVNQEEDIEVELVAYDGQGREVNQRVLFKTDGQSPRIGAGMKRPGVITMGESFVWEIGEEAFEDPDGTRLSFEAELSNGEGLPPWIIFHPESGRFSGEAVVAGTWNIRVRATDGCGQQVSDVFDIQLYNSK